MQETDMEDGENNYYVGDEVTYLRDTRKQLSLSTLMEQDLNQEPQSRSYDDAHKILKHSLCDTENKFETSASPKLSSVTTKETELSTAVKSDIVGSCTNYDSGRYSPEVSGNPRRRRRSKKPKTQQHASNEQNHQPQELQTNRNGPPSTLIVQTPKVPTSDAIKVADGPHAHVLVDQESSSKNETTEIHHLSLQPETESLKSPATFTLDDVHHSSLDLATCQAATVSNIESPSPVTSEMSPFSKDPMLSMTGESDGTDCSDHDVGGNPKRRRTFKPAIKEPTTDIIMQPLGPGSTVDIPDSDINFIVAKKDEYCIMGSKFLHNLKDKPISSVTTKETELSTAVESDIVGSCTNYDSGRYSPEVSGNPRRRRRSKKPKTQQHASNEQNHQPQELQTNRNGPPSTLMVQTPKVPTSDAIKVADGPHAHVLVDQESSSKNETTEIHHLSLQPETESLKSPATFTLDDVHHISLDLATCQAATVSNIESPSPVTSEMSPFSKDPMLSMTGESDSTDCSDHDVGGNPKRRRTFKPAIKEPTTDNRKPLDIIMQPIGPGSTVDIPDSDTNFIVAKKDEDCIMGSKILHNLKDKPISSVTTKETELSTAVESDIVGSCTNYDSGRYSPEVSGNPRRRRRSKKPKTQQHASNEQNHQPQELQTNRNGPPSTLMVQTPKVPTSDAIKVADGPHAHVLVDQESSSKNETTEIHHLSLQPETESLKSPATFTLDDVHHISLDLATCQAATVSNIESPSPVTSEMSPFSKDPMLSMTGESDSTDCSDHDVGGNPKRRRTFKPAIKEPTTDNRKPLDIIMQPIGPGSTVDIPDSDTNFIVAKKDEDCIMGSKILHNLKDKPNSFKSIANDIQRPSLQPETTNLKPPTLTFTKDNIVDTVTDVTLKERDNVRTTESSPLKSNTESSKTSNSLSQTVISKNSNVMAIATSSGNVSACISSGTARKPEQCSPMASGSRSDTETSPRALHIFDDPWDGDFSPDDGDSDYRPDELLNTSITSNESVSAEPGNTPRTKKRAKRGRADKDNWNYSQNKFKRMKGESYCGRRKSEHGKVVFDVEKNARSVKPRCDHNDRCKYFECHTITEDARQQLFKRYWGLSWESKKVFVQQSVIKKDVDRRKCSGNSLRRGNTFKYTFNLSGKSVKVCKKMYLNTLNIGEWSVHNWVRKEDNTEESAVGNNKRNNSVKAFEEFGRNHAREFLDKLPKLESHYCRKTTNKLYLEQIWQSKEQLYREYVKSLTETGKQEFKVSQKLFFEAFHGMNLSLFSPKKDQCDLCCAFKVGNITNEVYTAHREKKERAREEKTNDKNSSDPDTMVLTFDLQAVLLSPLLQASSLYFKQKLKVHNFTLYDVKTHDGYCYIWHECEGGVTANEFCSILHHFIGNYVPPNVKRIIFWSDGCTNQNRNAILANALLQIAVLKGITITHKYLEKGHTQMEADSMHSTIERQLKNRDIYVPAQYVDVCKNARLGKPYVVNYLQHSMFLNFSTMPYLKSIRPGNKTGESTVFDLRCINYRTDGTIFIKTQFSAEFEKLNRKIKKPRQSDSMPRLYNSRLPIPKSKYIHLQELKEVIPHDLHSFYDNLPHDCPDAERNENSCSCQKEVLRGDTDDS